MGNYMKKEGGGAEQTMGLNLSSNYYPIQLAACKLCEVQLNAK